MLPQDTNMLFSYINMNLRDKYEDLEDMAATEGFSAEEIISKLESAGFIYEDGRFKRLEDTK